MHLSIPFSRPMRVTTVATALLLFSEFSLHAIERISIAANGNEIAGFCYVSDITPDGRYVVFHCSSDDVVPGDSNGRFDVFVLDREDDSIERISVNSNEGQATDFDCTNGSISNDGRYVAFHSMSSQLVMNDTNGRVDTFVRDRQGGGTTVRVSLSDGGMELTGNSRGSISGNGLFVVFACDSDDAIMGDTNMLQDIFRRDLQNPGTIRVSVSNGGMQGSGKSDWPTISDDGNRIGFISAAEDLIMDDDNMQSDLFVRDVLAGTTTRLSVTHTGAQQENGGCNESAVISADGLTVAFASSADNLLPGITVQDNAVYVREIATNNLELVSIPTDPTTHVEGSNIAPTLSPDGRYVGFTSDSQELEPRNPSIFSHGFVRDRQTQQTATVNISTTGEFASNDGAFPTSSSAPLFASDGVYVFDSDSDELVPGDTDTARDIYQSTFVPVVAAVATPDNSALCTSLKNKLKKLKKKFKKLKKSGKKAKSKKLKKKIKKLKKQLKALGC